MKTRKSSRFLLWFVVAFFWRLTLFLSIYFFGCLTHFKNILDAIVAFVGIMGLGCLFVTLLIRRVVFDFPRLLLILF